MYDLNERAARRLCRSVEGSDANWRHWLSSKHIWLPRFELAVDDFRFEVLRSIDPIMTPILNWLKSQLTTKR